MTEIFEYVVGRYGERVELVFENNTVSVSAFLQPATTLDKRYHQNAVTEVGLVDKMRYLYLGPAEIGLGDCLSLECRGRSFEALNWEIVYAGKEKCCCWAILRRTD